MSGRRLLAAGLAILVVLAAGWFFLLRTDSVAPELTIVLPTSVIGTGEDAVGVSADGRVLAWQPLPEDARLPQLALDEPPSDGRLDGPALDQARVLGAAPAALRACVAAASSGEGGVDVELRSGIEIQFGGASRAAEKWAAAATVLADPSITALDYVNVQVPARPVHAGSGHVLPSAEEPSAGGCGE